jgi:hypothetical protein
MGNLVVEIVQPDLEIDLVEFIETGSIEVIQGRLRRGSGDDESY